MEKKMIERINEEIRFEVMVFKMTGKNDARAVAKINGMIEMLRIANGKKYSYNEDGVFEVK